MNKKYIKLFMIIITVLLSFFTFLSTRYEYSTVSEMSVLLSLFFSLPIVMHSKYNMIKNRKIKLIYLIVMVILYLSSFLIIFCLIWEIIMCKNNIFLKFDTFREIFANLLFMTMSWLLLFFSFLGIECRENEISFILNIVVLVIVILVHVNYFVNPNLKTIINESMIGEKAFYITQNYIYFGFMYFLLILNQLLNLNFNVKY